MPHHGRHVDFSRQGLDMMRRAVPYLLCLVCSLFCARTASAQAPYTLSADVPNVSLVFARLFGPNGLTVDSDTDINGNPATPGSTTHIAHFNSAFQSEFSQFSEGVARKLVSVPLPSPASSFIYEYNAAGDLVRSQKSLGPILAERTETVGLHRTSFGFAVQRFDFTTVEGLDLGALPAVFQHDDAQETGGKADVVSTVNNIQASVGQFTAFITYGLTDRIDLSVAIPIVSTSISVRSVATIDRLGSANADVHYFRQSDGTKGTQRIFTASGRASGVGDITVRVKSLAARLHSSALGLGVDLRIPTGDEKNLLGSGAAGLKPFLIWSGTYGVASPHINLGYQWNGSSPLAGSFLAGDSQPLADQMSFAGGADLRLSSRVTAAFDVLGDRVINAPRLVSSTFARSGAVLPTIGFLKSSFTEWNGAAGMKVVLSHELLFNANLLFKLNDSGLRSRVTALFGLGYSL
jgi:outer membrane putative beta-barrel porin/alpha-amylase